MVAVQKAHTVASTLCSTQETWDYGLPVVMVRRLDVPLAHGVLDHLRGTRHGRPRHRCRHPLTLELLLLHLCAVRLRDTRFADGVTAPGAGTTTTPLAATGGFTTGGAATAAATTTFTDGTIGPAVVLVPAS